jgi:hypothetical protein
VASRIQNLPAFGLDFMDSNVVELWPPRGGYNLGGLCRWRARKIASAGGDARDKVQPTTFVLRPHTFAPATPAWRRPRWRKLICKARRGRS